MFAVTKIQEPIHLYYISKHPFPAGISRAWAELERHITKRSGLKFYGIFDGQQYLASCDNPRSVSILRESLQEYVIPVGKYLTHTIHDWQDNKEHIALTFQEMEAVLLCDNASADIEFYKSNRELICLKALKK